jgi:hypothetical protein
VAREKPQAEALHKHPEPYQHDLNPDAMAGQNIGLGETQPAKTARTAYDIKPVHARLSQLSDADLKQIHVLPERSRLEQGATYLDLNNLALGEFTATGDMHAGRGNWFVAKKTVAYDLWNLLLSASSPEQVETTKA